LENPAVSESLKRVIVDGRHDVVLFSRELLGIEPHPGQQEFLNNGIEKVNVLVPANRFGKTTALAIKHIHRAFYKIGVPEGNYLGWAGAEYLTAALAPSSQQAEVVLRTIKQILTSSFSIRYDGKSKVNKCLIGWFVKRISESFPMIIEYINGSKTLIRSTETDKAASIAAKAFGYIGYDEACKSLHLEEELKSTLLPRLSDFNGTIDLVGTPDAASASFVYFQELYWLGGGDGNPKQDHYYSQEGSALDNPHLPPGYFKEMTELYKGDPRLDQVLHGKFISVGDKVFDHKSVLEAATEIDEYIPFESNHRYIISVDTAIGNDELVLHVIDWTEKPFKVCRIQASKGNSKSPQMHLQDMVDIFGHYNQEQTCDVIIETFSGEALRYYYDLPTHIRMRTRCFGSGRPMGIIKKQGQIDRKEDILIAARKVLDNHDIVFSNKHRKLIQQLANYTQKDEKIQTDWTISFCLGVWYATDGRPSTNVLQATSVNW